MQLLNRSLDLFRQNGVSTRSSSRLERAVPRIANFAAGSRTGREQLERIAQGLAGEGFGYGDHQSFFVGLNEDELNCQGNAFVYSLVSDHINRPEVNKARLSFARFANPLNQASHVALGLDAEDQIWETTKPGMVYPAELYGFGYPQQRRFSWTEAGSIPEAIIVGHFSSQAQHQELFDFIDRLAIYNGKYPSIGFYLRHKLNALEELYKQNLTSEAEYVDAAQQLVSLLLVHEPRDLDLLVQKAKLKFLSKEAPNDVIDLLQSFDDDQLESATGGQKQQIFFLLGHANLMRFLQHQRPIDRETALQYFEKVIDCELESELSKLAIKNIESLQG